MHKVKHLARQRAFTSISERRGCFKQLAELECGTIIACHYYNKSLYEISSLLDRSTVSHTIAKSKGLRTTKPQPQSGRAHIVTESSSAEPHDA